MGAWAAGPFLTPLDFKDHPPPETSLPLSYEGHVSLAPGEATWVGRGQAEIGAQAFWSPDLVRLTLALVTAVHQAQSSIQQVTSGDSQGLG